MAKKATALKPAARPARTPARPVPAEAQPAAVPAPPPPAAPEAPPVDVKAIIAKLERLADIRAGIRSVQFRCDEKRKALLSPQVVRALDAIAEAQEAELAPCLADAAVLENQIKADIIAHKASVKGPRLHGVYTPPPVTANVKMLQGMVKFVPQIADALGTGKPRVSIKDSATVRAGSTPPAGTAAAAETDPVIIGADLEFETGD